MSEGKIFISYRRGVDGDSAARLHDRLASKLGRDRLFYDIDSIPIGVDFHEYLHDHVARCEAFVAVIGQGWLDAAERLHDENDFVRIEIEAALARPEILVIPVLVHGVTMPKPATLPENLHAFTRRNAVTVPYEHFFRVVDGRIVAALSALTQPGNSGVDVGTTESEASRVGSAPPLEPTRDNAADMEIPANPEEPGSETTSHGEAQKPVAHRSGKPTTKPSLKFKLEGHEGEVHSVAFSPDGARLASAGLEGAVQLWDLGTGAKTVRMSGHGSWFKNYGVNSIAFSPDGLRLASAGEDGTVCLWDAGTGAETARLKGHKGQVYSVAFSPDGAQLASAGDDGTIRLWDAATGADIERLKGRYSTTIFSSIAFSPDGARLASANTDGIIQLWDVGMGNETSRLEGHEEKWVHSVAFSPDGLRLASAGDDGTVRLWDAAKGAETARLERSEGSVGIWFIGSWVNSVAFSPDGTQLASAGGDGTIRLRDLQGEG